MLQNSYGQCRTREEAIALGVYITKERDGSAGVDLSDAESCFSDVTSTELRWGFASLELWGKLCVAERMFAPDHLIIIGSPEMIDAATIDAAEREFRAALKEGKSEYGN